MPFAAGCQSIGIFTYRENERPNPRAVVGLIDLSARKNVRRQLGRDTLSFSVTAEMFRRMEADVEGSFLERELWKSLLEEDDGKGGRENWGGFFGSGAAKTHQAPLGSAGPVCGCRSLANKPNPKRGVPALPLSQSPPVESASVALLLGS
jgi:hypothetical protein